MGADRVNWLDFVFYQNRNHKQYMINELAAGADFVAINHPKFSRGMYLEDMKYLSGYHCLEVLNRYRNSVEYWDAALSAGRRVFLIANDDVHDSTKIRQLARRITIVNSDNTKEAIVSALKNGHTYGIDLFQGDKDDISIKYTRLKDLVKPVDVNVTNELLRISLSSTVQEIRFIGQGGLLKKVVKNTHEASYKMASQDTYIRMEITALDGSVLYLNPIYKYTVDANTNVLAVVDGLITTLKRGFALVIIILAFIYKASRIFRAGHCTSVWSGKHNEHESVVKFADRSRVA